MLEAIKEIGEIRLGEEVKESDILESLLDDPPKPKKEDIELHTVILNYNTFDRQIGIEFEAIKDDTSQRYLWLGELSRNTPRFYFTTTNLDYLISQVIPNLHEKADKESSLYKALNRVIDSMFYYLGLPGRYKFVLNIEKCGLAEEGYMAKLLKKIEESKSKDLKDSEIFKDVIKDIRDKMDEFINQQTPLKKKDIGLYTLKINDNLMVEDEEYQKIAIKEKINSLFDEEKRKVCSLCGEYKLITDRPKFDRAGCALGYYITDKVGFSSNLSGDFTKNFILCKDCYKRLLVGESFIRNRLRQNIGGINLYIIPKFLFPVQFSLKQLNRWADYIKFTFNSAKSFESLKDFEKKLQDYHYYEDTKNNFILNLLFFKAGQSFKVLKLIEDVSPTRLDVLIKTTNKIKDVGYDILLGENNQWKIDLQTIYYLIPLRRKKGEIIEYHKLLEFYDAIFSGKPVSYQFLIQQFVELAQVYRFKKFDVYNININIGKQEPDREMVYAILKANLLLLYLRELKLLKGGEGSMDYDSLDVKEEMREFVKEMGYDEAKVAMFLLGYLIGEIGNAQSPSKPILNKITYQGMNRNKLKMLSNDVFEKLRQYKSKEGKTLLHYESNEKIFAECKRLMDKTIEKPLSDQENVFYVLSGYAYATHQAIERASQYKKAKEDKKEVDINEQSN